MRDLLEKTLEEVRKEKASGDIIFQSSKSLKLSAFGKELTEYKVSGSQLLGLRLIKNNKVGLAYTESLDRDSLNYLVKTALQNAEASSENEYEFVSFNEGEVHDEELSHQDEVDVEIKVKKVTSLLEDFKKRDSRVESLPYNGYVENENFNMYLNTHNR
ncbi:MAG TPA: DNA gyrase modulator, partial [Bacteriovoracaceae bacterium]|nr:DNA gyrase modulator [Bacteriovoracaceae bacterium]